MFNTTLCYIEKDGQYLMLYRNKKKNDFNEGKWIGVGGKFEEGEDPETCLLREVKEETGLTLNNYRLRGIITFRLNDDPTETMFLFTSDSYTGEISSCNEGELHWVDIDKVPSLNLWEGDKVFMKLLAENAPFFLLTLFYEGDNLVYKKLSFPQ